MMKRWDTHSPVPKMALPLALLSQQQHLPTQKKPWRKAGLLPKASRPHVYRFEEGPALPRNAASLARFHIPRSLALTFALPFPFPLASRGFSLSQASSAK